MDGGEVLERPAAAKVRQRVAAPDPQAELRRQYIAACKAWRKAVERDGDSGPPPIDFTPFTDLICGARGKRTGRPCPQKGLYSNGRCKWHGGASTGPRTPEGKARSMANHMKGHGMTSEALEGGEVAGRVEPAPAGLAVAEAHEAASIPLLPAGAEDAVDQVRADQAAPVADPLITPRSADGAPAEPAEDPKIAPRLPTARRVGPMTAVKEALGCSGKARWSGRPLTAPRIAAVTGLELGVVESALRMLVMTRQVERQDGQGGAVVYVARAAG